MNSITKVEYKILKSLSTDEYRDITVKNAEQYISHLVKLHYISSDKPFLIIDLNDTNPINHRKKWLLTDDGFIAMKQFKSNNSSSMFNSVFSFFDKIFSIIKHFLYILLITIF